METVYVRGKAGDEAGRLVRPDPKGLWVLVLVQTLVFV